MEFIKTGRKSEEIRHTFGAHKDGVGRGRGCCFYTIFIQIFVNVLYSAM